MKLHLFVVEENDSTLWTLEQNFFVDFGTIVKLKSSGQMSVHYEQNWFQNRPFRDQNENAQI